MLRRKHPYFLLARVALPVILLLLWAGSLTLMPGVLDSFRPDPFTGRGSAPGWVVAVVTLAWLVLGLPGAVWAAYAVLGWLGNWIAITTRRVVVLDKLPMLRETRREAPLAKVQNVEAEYPHLLGTTLDFGTLTVDTAGIGVLTFEGVPRPKLLREAIFAQQEALKSNRPDPEERRRSAIRGILRGGVAAYAGLTQATRLEGTLEPPAEVQPTYVWRRHVYFLLKGLALPLAAFGAIVLVWVWASASGGGVVSELAGWGALVALPLVAAWTVWSIEDWRNDQYVLDPERVLHVESLPLGLREQSKETVISRITDVTYNVPGPLANLLDFGDVTIKTPGESTEFVFAGVPQPREVHAEIIARVDEHRLRESAGVDGEIEGWLRAWHEVASDEQGV